MPENLQNEKERHTYLLSEGIAICVNWLAEHIDEQVIMLGFSVGGTIAWKAALLGATIEKMLLVSSTRIRKENECPDSPIKLIFGKDDEYKPKEKWGQEMNLSQIEVPDEGHLVYHKWDLIKEEVLGFL